MALETGIMLTMAWAKTLSTNEPSAPRGACRAVFAFAIALFLMLAVTPLPVYAIGGCDPEFMDALNNRALIESKRESAQNKNLIYKPDSVLEYSCIFAQVSSAQALTPITVHAGSWDHIITTPAFNFLAHNFGHTYLGGRYDIGMPSLPGATYFCDAQARMWEMARCIDFHQYPDAEGFFDFNWFMNDDPRKYPAFYDACKPAVEAINLREAFNGLEAQWTLNPDPATDAEPYKTEAMASNMPRISWDYDDTCGDPVPTGLTIRRFQWEEDEYICVKPGCTNVGGSCVRD